MITRASEGERAASAPVLAGSYQLASLLAFYLPDHPETDAPFETGSGAQYVAWRTRALPAGTPAWYFTRMPGDVRVGGEPTGASARTLQLLMEAAHDVNVRYAPPAGLGDPDDDVIVDTPPPDQRC